MKRCSYCLSGNVTCTRTISTNHLASVFLANEKSKCIQKFYQKIMEEQSFCWLLDDSDSDRPRLVNSKFNVLSASSSRVQYEVWCWISGVFAKHLGATLDWGLSTGTLFSHCNSHTPHQIISVGGAFFFHSIFPLKSWKANVPGKISSDMFFHFENSWS